MRTLFNYASFILILVLILCCVGWLELYNILKSIQNRPTRQEIALKTMENKAWTYSGIVSWSGYATITGYCLNKNPMASGKMTYKGAVACLREIPLGTKIIINQTKYTCEDRLALKYDERFDIWFKTCQEAKNWGIQNLFIEILTND